MYRDLRTYRPLCLTSPSSRFLRTGWNQSDSLFFYSTSHARVSTSGHRSKANECPSDQVPFAIKIKTGSYIDLIPDKVESCSSVPAVCLNAYRANGIDKTTDPLFQELERQALSFDETLRIVPYNNLTDGVFHYYYGTVNQLQADTNTNIIGCATEIPIRSNYIYQVDSTQKHD